MSTQEAVECLKLAKAYIDEVSKQVVGVEVDRNSGFKLLDTLKLAIKQIDKAEQLDPKAEYDGDNIRFLRAKAIGFHGVVELDVFKNVSNAISYFKKSIGVYDGVAVVHAYLGSLYVLKGKKKEAVAAFRKAVSLDPDEVEFRKELDRVENTSDFAMFMTRIRQSWSLVVTIVVVALCGACICLVIASSLLNSN